LEALDWVWISAPEAAEGVMAAVVEVIVEGVVTEAVAAILGAEVILEGEVDQVEEIRNQDQALVICLA